RKGRPDRALHAHVQPRTDGLDHGDAELAVLRIGTCGRLGDDAADVVAGSCGLRYPYRETDAYRAVRRQVQHVRIKCRPGCDVDPRVRAPVQAERSITRGERVGGVDVERQPLRRLVHDGDA